MNPQRDSLLFQRLPQEIRDNIFSCLFYSTAVGCGHLELKTANEIKDQKDRNALAVIRTCRRARHEIGDSWLSQIQFTYRDVEHLLDKLEGKPEIYTRIRRLGVLAYFLSLTHADRDRNYGLAAAFRMLPGLRLDELTVLCSRYEEISHDVFDGLIRHSMGWKELRFISDSSEVLAFDKDAATNPHPDDPDQHRYWRHPQPSHWQSLLEDLDGPASKPSVVIYRSTVPGRHRSVLDPRTRVRFEQPVPEDETERENYGRQEDSALMAAGERDKGILVVAKRGFGADYEVREDSPFLYEDIREQMPGMDWNEIKWEGKYRFYEDHLYL
ncbi:hypothetical protein FALBO_850 [Fusarium albosuccineum]|uniref:Uncharacterized protein n=1 Tax=Fusarium albosuccineum TaxID=1237068 RepID=A0A8H4LQT9_9HYPO|nr:hypothetical protein FALBO_850 [Fusarium albosuccineum]